MTEIKEVTIRLAKRDEAVEISDLLNKLGLNLPNEHEVDKINQHWDRLWKNNPYYNHFKEDYLYGWVMVYNEKIVGFFGCIPRIYSINSKVVPVAIASQWGVEKDYRKFTHLLCEKFFNENPISIKLVTTAIKPTGRIFEKYGGLKVPNSELETVYMIPIDLFKLVSYKYKDSFKKYIFNFLSYLIPWKLQFKFIGENNNFKEIDVDSIPDEINSFFENKLNKTNGLIALRDSDILKWYYSGGNRELTKKIFIYSKNDTILGYASIVEEPIKDNLNLKRYKIIDLLAENSQIKKDILKALIKYSYNKKIDVLEIHHSGMIDKNEIPAIILKRKLPQFPLFYQTTDSKMNEYLKHKDNWNIMPFDGDTCLG